MEGFSQSTGLKVNHAESCLVLLNLTPEKAVMLAGVLMSAWIITFYLPGSAIRYNQAKD